MGVLKRKHNTILINLMLLKLARKGKFEPENGELELRFQGVVSISVMFTILEDLLNQSERYRMTE